MQDQKKAARAWTRAQARAGRRAAFPAVGLGLAATICGAGQALCLALALGARLRGEAGPFWPALAGFAALALVRALVQYAAERAAFRAGASGRRRLRESVVSRLLACGPAILRARHSAALAAAVVDQVEAMDGLYGRWVPAVTVALAGPLLILGAAAVADPIAALILAGFGLLVPVGQAVAGIGAAAASRRQFLALERLQARFLDRVRGIATIVLAGQTGSEAEALAGAADELRRRTMRVLRVVFLSSAALDCATAGALVALALRYRHALMSGGSATVTALFLILLVPEFFAPLRAFAMAYQDKSHATGAAEALMELPEPPPPIPEDAIRRVEARGVVISAEDVWLRWDETRPPALAGLSFFVGAGETLVLAGPSGAGKSSVIELLLGFARPDSGHIRFNGHDIADINPAALSALTAWIGQRPMLFAGTIRDNIRFARPDASDADIEAAAAQALVTDFACALPRGLDTPIGEGGYGLSGGQAQRVAIARAYLKNAPLLLLDEPTAHLDPATEQDVLAALRRLAVGRTVVMASHSAAAHAFGGRRLDLRDGRALPAKGAAVA